MWLRMVWHKCNVFSSSTLVVMRLRYRSTRLIWDLKACREHSQHLRHSQYIQISHNLTPNDTLPRHFYSTISLQSA